jgi:hypothetical protein
MTSDLTKARSVSLIVGMLITCLAAADSFKVTPTTSADYEPGFRCSFWSPGQETSGESLLQADDDSVPSPKALIGIDGTKYMLSSKSITWHRKRKDDLNIGDAMVLRFDDKAVGVIVRAAVTWMCPRGDEGCEITRYRAKIKVTFQGVTKTVAADGSCGS